MADAEKENNAAIRIQCIQRGKSVREGKQQKDVAAAKIQSIHRGKSVRLEQKMKEEAAAKLLSTTDAVVGKEDEVPQSNDFDSTSCTNFGAETRITDFGNTGNEIRGGETINTTKIDKFLNFTKKDGHFTGLYPETTEALLSSPRKPTPLQQAQEDLVVEVGQKQYKSVRENFKYCKWYARKSNAVSMQW